MTPRHIAEDLTRAIEMLESDEPLMRIAGAAQLIRSVPEAIGYLASQADPVDDDPPPVDIDGLQA